MVSLILNVLLLLIGAGGSIVSALALPDTVWRKRTVIGFALMGIIGLVLTVAAYDNTPDVPHISGTIADMRSALSNFAKDHSWFWPVLFFFLGIGAGTYLGI
jgi:hypothetical protein